ncbi:hypothetical protein G210_0064 [Candida maltosa Xu316]|uniref:Uncharacterized protein n=1 Tax=Candida maltosa (strain Xu316) TaxID=1245528 RepID=M3HP31_CANMX|nr:hypothetical protein G210_0064 [Candida maltosa Xu316]
MELFVDMKKMWINLDEDVEEEDG